MKKCMALALSIGLIGFVTMADIAFGGFGIAIKKGSIKCEEVVTGVSRTELNTDAVVCAIRITEIERSCVNPNRHSDPAQGTPYDVNVELVHLNQGSALPLTKQGKSFSVITFEDDEIKATLPPELVDPALVCPNANWDVVVKVSKFDAIGEVVSQSGGGCTVNQDTFDFNSCVVSANASTCHQEECVRLSPCVDNGSTTYACTCVEHLIDGVSQSKCVYGIK